MELWGAGRGQAKVAVEGLFSMSSFNLQLLSWCRQKLRSYMWIKILNSESVIWASFYTPNENMFLKLITLIRYQFRFLKLWPCWILSALELFPKSWNLLKPWCFLVQGSGPQSQGGRSWGIATTVGIVTASRCWAFGGNTEMIDLRSDCRSWSHKIMTVVISRLKTCRNCLSKLESNC